jgi:hypothetical protein
MPFALCVFNPQSAIRNQKIPNQINPNSKIQNYNAFPSSLFFPNPQSEIRNPQSKESASPPHALCLTSFAFRLLPYLSIVAGP